MAQTLDELLSQFPPPPGVPGGLPGFTLERGAGGLLSIAIKTEQCEARVFLHGGHIAQWAPIAPTIAGKPPTPPRPALHLSPKSAFDPKKAIRGGIPICFPWFGNRADDPKPNGAPSPAHGFARTRQWTLDKLELEDNGRVKLEMVLTDDDETRALWDASFEARLSASIGVTLSVSLDVRNTGDTDFEFEEALHTYLEVGDVERVRVLGLEGTRYVDKVDAMKEKRTGREPLVLTGETDSVFLGTKGAITVDDPALGRTVRVEKAGSQATVVWNPWLVRAQTMLDVGGEAWRSFLCVEAANVRPYAVPLPPGAVHTMTTRLQVHPH